MLEGQARLLVLPSRLTRNSTEAPMFRYSAAQFFLLIAAILLTGGSAAAHDLWILTEPPNPKIGEHVIVRVVLGHNFPAGSMLPNSDLMKVVLMDPSGTSSVLVTKPNGIYQEAEFVRDREGTYVITAEVKQYFAEIDGKMYHEPKDKLAVNPQFSSYAQQAARAEIGGSSGASKPAGLPLEIVPQVDPATLHVGDLLPVRVYAHGKPVAPLTGEEVEVRAVYAGFQADEDTFAFSAHIDKEGNCRIKLTQSGQWMALVERNLSPSNPAKSNLDHYDSTLTFKILK
jgi:uncharacterized GH25 family protein